MRRWLLLVITCLLLLAMLARQLNAGWRVQVMWTAPQRLLACNIRLRGLRFGSDLQTTPKPTGPSQNDAKRELRLLVTGDTRS